MSIRRIWSLRGSAASPSAALVVLAVALVSILACGCMPSALASSRPASADDVRGCECNTQADAAMADAEMGRADAAVDFESDAALEASHDSRGPRSSEPFRLEPASHRVELVAGRAVMLEATLIRAPGDDTLVELSAAGLPAEVEARVAIGADGSRVAFVLDASDLATPVTEWPFIIQARTERTSSVRRVLLTVRAKSASGAET